MKHIKSHFTFSKQQRNGIFLLLLIIILLQVILVFSDFTLKEHSENNKDFLAFQKKIDSIKRIPKIEGKQKIFPFNPNFITDYKGYTLGMTNEEIDKLIAFRAQDKWVNSAKEFQQITGVSDSLLNEISPYFKFPDWVTNPKQNNYKPKAYDNKPKTFSQKTDLNQATAAQLKMVYGVGEKLSERIIIYRNKFEGGFIADIQLTEVYGLSPEVIENINKQFTVKTPRPIQKINLNTATKEQLVSIQHIDYEIAYNIIEFRTLREGFLTLDDLSKVKDFPVKKIEIIKLYLTLN